MSERVQKSKKASRCTDCQAHLTAAPCRDARNQSIECEPVGNRSHHPLAPYGSKNRCGFRLSGEGFGMTYTDKLIVPVGARRGKTKVLQESDKRWVGGRYLRFVELQCDCGKILYQAFPMWRYRPTMSCRNCIMKPITHGKSGSAIYHVWKRMILRCRNSRDKGWHNYGGRGISVCNRWQSFENFYADVGDAPPGLSLGRIDNDGNYEPSNCRWENDFQQLRNTRRTVFIEAFGKRMPRTEAAEQFRINIGTLTHRLARGWHPERALTEPTSR